MVLTSLGSLLILVLLALAGFALASSTSMTIEEAKRACEQFDKRSVTRQQVESIFGKPIYDQTHDNFKKCTWHFTSSSLEKIELFSVIIYARRGEDTYLLSTYDGVVTGKNAWILRWIMLKARLGFKVD